MIVDKELIRKYLEGKCNKPEQLEAEAMLRLPDAELVLSEVMAELLPQDIRQFKSEPLSAGQAADWTQKIHSRIHAAEVIRLDQPKPYYFLRQVASWVAVLLLGVLGVWGWNNYQTQKVAAEMMLARNSYEELFNAKGKRSKITLADGSVVHLGANSRLKFPKLFQEGSREIFLEGEAFFEISKNPKKPFIVHSGEMQTKVLGTSFKVDAFKAEAFSVAVATGKVRVDQFKNGKLFKAMAVLLPGEKISMNQQTGNYHVLHQDISDTKGWLASKLVFNAQGLQQIADVLERWYDVKIDFANTAWKSKAVTITLQANLPLVDLMTVLSEGVGFKYKIKNKQIVIY